MASTPAVQEDGTILITGIGASETSDPIDLRRFTGSHAAIQAEAGGGTGFNSGTLTVQRSNDKTNWHTAKDVAAADITFTAAGMAELLTGARYIRLSADASINDVDVTISLGL